MSVPARPRPCAMCRAYVPPTGCGHWDPKILERMAHTRQLRAAARASRAEVKQGKKTSADRKTEVESARARRLALKEKVAARQAATFEQQREFLRQTALKNKEIT